MITRRSSGSSIARTAGDSSEALGEFFARVVRVPLLKKREEMDLGRLITRKQREMRTLAFSSPAARRLLLSWAVEMAEGDISAKELMPRGRRTRPELRAMARKVRSAARHIEGCRRKLKGLRGRLRRTRAGSTAHRKLLTSIERTERSAALRIDALRLGEKRISRIIEAAGRRHRRIRELRDEVREHKNALVRANMRLVVSVVKKYRYPGFEFLDLVQEGALGLRRAADKFEFSKGYRFSTYATWWIRQSVQRAVALQERTVRLPVHVRDLLSRMAKFGLRFHQKAGREPSVGEYSKTLKVETPKIEQALALTQDTVSLSWTPSQDSESTLGDVLVDRNTLTPPDFADEVLRRAELETMLAKLDPREAEVIRLRFGLDTGKDRTLAEIGRRLRVTRERIRQIEVGAIKKLREKRFSGALAEYYRP